MAIDHRSVRRALLVVIALLTAASFLVQVARHFLDRPMLGGVTKLFDANSEGNIPTYYSAVTLLACAVLLALTGVAERPRSRAAWRRWLGLAALAALASLDEAAEIHEAVGRFIARDFAPGGYLYFVWPVAAAPLVLAVALAYRGFVAGLPTQLRRVLMLGAGVWVGSALLVELVEGRIVSLAGFGSFEHEVVGTLQEAGEMLGVLIILDGLLGHLAERRTVVVGTIR